MKTYNNAPLSPYTSLHIGGPAKTLLELEKDDDLVKVISEVSGPLWVLGFGSNCLISDKGLNGTVILNRKGKITQLSSTRFKVDSGVNWDDFILHLQANKLCGLEFTSGIPGGVGAAVTGNIAAYGQKVADCFIEANILDPKTGDVTIWPKTKLRFDYRSSALQLPANSHLVVIDATFELSAEPTGELAYESALKIARELGVEADTLETRRKIIMETRKRAGSLITDAKSGPWTAGSFFKNPVVDETQIQTILSHEERGVKREDLIRQQILHGEHKARVSAAHVLLAAGFKRGQSWGNVGLHPDHILKVENLGNASAQEVYDVVQYIVRTVKGKLGITLEPEVRFLGEFDT